MQGTLQYRTGTYDRRNSKNEECGPGLSSVLRRMQGTLQYRYRTGTYDRRNSKNEECGPGLSSVSEPNALHISWKKVVKIRFSLSILYKVLFEFKEKKSRKQYLWYFV